MIAQLVDVHPALFQERIPPCSEVPEGWYARLMQANFDRLVDGAVGAAKISHQAVGPGGAQFALLISCVGRKLVLKQRTEEELEAVQEVLGAGVPLAGFYSYGEICPAVPNAGCELHNAGGLLTSTPGDP